MNARIKGIVIDTASGHEWASGTVRVSDSSSWHNHVLPLVSFEETIPLMPGLKLSFLVAEIDGKGAVALGAMLNTPQPNQCKGENPQPITQSMLFKLGERAVVLAGEKRSRKDSAIGIGGAQHQYIQRVVRDLAHELGFKATIEQQIPGGMVDVAIEGKSISIGCEVPVSTKYHEWKNIKKCLDAGYHFVISVSLEASVLETVKRNTLHRLTPEEQSRVLFLFPEDLEGFLKGVEERTGQVRQEEPVVRGYKVKVKYAQTSGKETAERRAAVAQVIARSLQRNANRQAS